MANTWCAHGNGDCQSTGGCRRLDWLSKLTVDRLRICAMARLRETEIERALAPTATLAATARRVSGPHRGAREAASVEDGNEGTSTTTVRDHGLRPWGLMQHRLGLAERPRSEEHTSELQSLR